MTVIGIPEDLSGLDALLEQLPDSAAVFLLWPREGEPYLARTTRLRRRLLRLLRERDRPGRLLNLRRSARRIEYYPVGSRLESAIRMYELARAYFPDNYLEVLRLRMLPYIRIALRNEFPRSRLTTRIGRGEDVCYGPFRSKASAEHFESGMLELFQMRRCREDLVPSPEHPGCIYGEMGMCLRPCQEATGPDEYRHEVDRVTRFLATDGRSLVESVERARDRFSEEMMFEDAARQHKRLEKIRELLQSRDELARDVDGLHGVAVTASVDSNAVELWRVRAGDVHAPLRFGFEVVEGRPAPMDRRLRELFAAAGERTHAAQERQERLAILARWFYSSWRDGEWIPFERFEQPPYRKLVHAISRAAKR